MIHKLKALFLFTLLVTSTLYAQQGSIQGIVLDIDSKEGIPYATVVITDATTSKTINGIVSNENGKFKANDIPFGTYTLEVSFMGYNSKTINSVIVDKQHSKVTVENIFLKISVESLNEVSITAKNKIQSTKIDRKTYNPSDFETAKGGTAADVLNKLPSVSVDPSGAVSVRGTTNFQVYLNGKPTQIEAAVLLAQIAGSNVNKVDVITVPTASFDAQGKGGIINITTKTNGVEGLSIAANGLIGGSPWSNTTDKYGGYKMNNDRYGGGLNLMYNTKKTSFYGGFNYNKRNVNGKRSGDARVLVEYPEGEYFHMVAAGERPEWYEYYTANAGIDFNLSDKDKLSVTYSYGNRTGGRAAYYIYNNYYADADDSNKDVASEDWIYNPNIDNRYGQYNTFNADYSLDISEDKNLKIAGSYENSQLSRELTNENYAYDPDTDTAGSTVEQQYSMSDDTPLSGFIFSADYSIKYSEFNSLKIGVRTNNVNIAGDFTFDNDLVTKDLDNSIDMDRGVYAGYVDFTGKTGELDYIVGLRMEFEDQKMHVTNTDYLNLFNNSGESDFNHTKLDFFPSVHLSYPVSDENSLILAASRRINRPSATALSPFLYRRHYEVYVLGDPELESEYTNNVELTYDTKIAKTTFDITGFYRGVNNAIFRVNTTTTEIENPDLHEILQENVLIRSYTNAGNSTSLGGEVNTDVYLGKYADLFLGGSLYYYSIKGEVFGYDVDNNSTNWSLKANLSLNLTDDLKFNMDYNIKSATITSQGQNDLYQIANAAFSYKPEKLEGWNFSLRGLDIFGSNIQGLDTNAFNSDGEQIFYQETSYVRNGPIVELGVSYALNMKGKKAKKAKAFEAEKHFK